MKTATSSTQTLSKLAEIRDQILVNSLSHGGLTYWTTAIPVWDSDVLHILIWFSDSIHLFIYVMKLSVSRTAKLRKFVVYLKNLYSHIWSTGSMNTWQCTGEGANVSNRGLVTGTGNFSGSTEDNHEWLPHRWWYGWIRTHGVTDTSRKVPHLKQLAR
jgi:hypothetical protein